MTIYLVEGEKDADRLWTLDLPATTNAGGVEAWKPWQAQYVAQLIAASVERVVVLPDNDDPGRAYADRVATACAAAGLTVVVVPLPGLRPKEDISDWLDAGHTTAELRALVAATPVFVPPTTTTAPDVDATACPVCGRDSCAGCEPAAAPGLVGFTIDELRAHVFPLRRALLLRGESPIVRDGSLAQVCAPRGVGKTWLLQTLGLVAATGGDALGFRAPERSRVLYVDGEMASDEIKDRFALLADRLGICTTDARPALTIVGADWQEDFLPRLDTLAGQMAVAPFVDSADLIILDNRSCLFDPNGEKDPEA